MAQNEQKKIQRIQRYRLALLGNHLLTLTTIIAFLFQGQQVVAEGNVGCHYLNSLCLEGIEFCYDDLVFGKCLSKSGVEMDDIDRSPLTEEQSRFLATMLEEMQGASLGWDHPFVQCRIQGTMFSIRRNTPLPPNLCANLAPDPEILGPQSPLAFVRFTPPNDDYADEVYYPPPKKLSLDNNRDYRESVPLTEKQRKAAENLELLSQFAHQPDILDDERKNIIRNTIAKQELINRMKDLRNRIELDKMLTEYERGELRPPIYTNNDIYPGEVMYDNDDNDIVNQQSEINDNLGAYKRTKTIKLPDKNEKNVDDQPKTYFREFAISEHIPLNQENIDGQFFNHQKSHPFEDLLAAKQLPKDSDVDFSGNIYPSKYNHKSDQTGVYTEGGGLVFFSNNNKDDETDIQREENKARNLIANMLAFTRHERLDVKKPGPMVGPPHPNLEKQIENKKEIKAENKEVLPAHIKGDTVPKTKKVAVKNHSGEDHGTFSVDNDYAHVIIKNPIDSWNEGLRIISALSDFLNINFTHPRVDVHEVSFRVEQNPEKKTASDVAKSINEVRVKNNISRRFGFIVLRAGVGNKVKHESESVMSARVELAEEGPDVTHIMAYMFAGAGTAAIIVIMVTLFLIKRHDRNRDKLGGLQQGTTGADSCSKDYQELCRARMAGKGQSQDSPASGGRITLLSKDNERPPSSRSSTSSWSEEPALTNMDISTGHMVLSYMEDHLRNKGRLQREWEALCRYEAEPSARDAALQEKCALLNRPNAPLPYDHSRVVLNHLANAEGLDYINASTITDHDPRAPAYVAAQGPLSTTLAHFWQMIWEQGAVVIVALCRLQENGETSCARYWPEEGAEVYHIYEVHLVSEHIWCDDYLVRSFYLKNLRTSETRTVTQFHFLSWPQGGVPPQAKPLLEFRRKVNKSYRGRSCPIVVHASAGAGRTGAYILLDLVLGRMNKGAREIDIAATLEHLRDQRASLVGTRQQFEFVLMAVAEEVHAILKALPANQSEKRELDKEPIVIEEDDKDVKKQEKPEKVEEVKEKTVQKNDEIFIDNVNLGLGNPIQPGFSSPLL